eukprot:gene16803-19964_t
MESETQPAPAADANRDVNRGRKLVKGERQRDQRRSWEKWQVNGVTAWSPGAEPPPP